MSEKAPANLTLGSLGTRGAGSRAAATDMAQAVAQGIETGVRSAARDGGHADLETALQWEAMAQPITLAIEDLQEGIRASQEKRPPEFRGR